MRLRPRGRHGPLLFRTYLILVGGLVATAAVLDYGFGRLQEGVSAAPSRWVDASLDLIEARLASSPPAERDGVVAELERELGFPVRLLPTDDVVHAGDEAQGTREIFDAAGRASYLRDSAALNAAIHIGPLAEGPAQPRWLGLVPPLFYLSIFVLVGLWLWPLIRDVDLLTAAARDFAVDYRRATATRGRASTLRDLAASFDEMSARIQSLIQGQKDLTSALSHEIRTPLARIKFAMAVIGSKAPIDAELESIEQDVREIDRLIGTMLEYARLDYPNVKAQWQLTAADTWLEQAVRKSLLGRGQQLRIAAPSSLVRMDPNLMELALSNLLVNACRYAARQLSVEITAGEDRYTLAVEDDGPGIPESAREHVFQAFARIDDSRSRGTGGYGLGLAIVARIAALHGGTARAEPSALGGARIALSWPTTPPP